MAYNDSRSCNSGCVILYEDYLVKNIRNIVTTVCKGGIISVAAESDDCFSALVKGIGSGYEIDRLSVKDGIIARAKEGTRLIIIFGDNKLIELADSFNDACTIIVIATSPLSLAALSLRGCTRRNTKYLLLDKNYLIDDRDDAISMYSLIAAYYTVAIDDYFRALSLRSGTAQPLEIMRTVSDFIELGNYGAESCINTLVSLTMMSGAELKNSAVHVIARNMTYYFDYSRSYYENLWIACFAIGELYRHFVGSEYEDVLFPADLAASLYWLNQNTLIKFADYAKLLPMIDSSQTMRYNDVVKEYKSELSAAVAEFGILSRKFARIIRRQYDDLGRWREGYATYSEIMRLISASGAVTPSGSLLSHIKRLGVIEAYL